jgi:1-hydroxycarotenoid 3,4-desaturase
LAPATLMLVAHVEQDGVWFVQGGMRRVADAIQRLAEAKGAEFRFGAEVAEILTRQGRASGVRLANGEEIPADAVVFNGDVAALAQGLLGQAPRNAAEDTPRAARSLSAVTWCVKAPTSGFPLVHHNVFFAEDYAAEFDAIFRRRDITAAPTVYVCAQDREAGPGPALGTPERMLVLINAPPDGDRRGHTPAEIAELGERGFGLLKACGLDVARSAGEEVVTTPEGFARLFPGSGGALYGRAGHGSTATSGRRDAFARAVSGGRFRASGPWYSHGGDVWAHCRGAAFERLGRRAGHYSDWGGARLTSPERITMRHKLIQHFC